MTASDFKLRYWVFSFDQYDRGGGLDDVEFTSDSEEEARLVALQTGRDFASIFDSITRETIYSNEDEGDGDGEQAENEFACVPVPG